MEFNPNIDWNLQKIVSAIKMDQPVNDENMIMVINEY